MRYKEPVMGNGQKTSVIKPEVIYLFELVREVAAGKIRVPAFQRPYVWGRTQMTDLLDSIRKHFPVGSLLVWEADKDTRYLDRIGPLAVPRPSGNKVRLLLDGHQRMATLVGVLWPKTTPDIDEQDPGRWTIWFNAETETFEHLGPRDEPQPHHYPMNRLMDTLDILKESKRMLEDGGRPAKTWIKLVQTVARDFQTFALPVINILGTEISEAVEIFARLNTMGRRMSGDQMFSALTYREEEGGLHLAQEIDDILQDLAGLGFGGIDRVVVLRTILAVLKEDIYSTDWTRMGKDLRGRVERGLRSAVEKTRQALKSAAKFLSEQGIDNHRLLPYAMQLVVLAAFFSRRARPTPEQRRFLWRWFWVSSYSGWFTQGNPSRVQRLVAEFRDEVSELDAPTVLREMDLDAPAVPFPRSFDMRSSRTRVLLSTLLRLEPRHPKGHILDASRRWIREFGPAAMGKIFADGASKELRISPANRLIAIDPKDRRQAKAWLADLDPTDDAQILASHAIEPETLGLLKSRNYEDFLQKRLEHLVKLERDFMEEKSVTPPPTRDVAPAPVDDEGLRSPG
jgi:hypothetical protein